MKNRLLKTAAPVVILTTLSFTSMKKDVDVKSSTVEWTGKKITGAAHHGTIDLKSGVLEFTEEGQLVGGTFTMDMNTIVVTDLEGEYKTKLENHLNNDDFFGVEKYSTSELVFTEVRSKESDLYEVTGDLTIKGETAPVKFDLQVKESSATAQVVIDRTKYGIRYGSGSFFSNLGDNTIKNDFTLDVHLKF